MELIIFLLISYYNYKIFWKHVNTYAIYKCILCMTQFLYIPALPQLMVK